MWRSIAIGVVLAGALAGCSLGQGAVDTVGSGSTLKARPPGTAPVNVQARWNLAELRARPASPRVPRVASLTCVVKPATKLRPKLASCRSMAGGVPLYATFYVGGSGVLRVPCVAWGNRRESASFAVDPNHTCFHLVNQ